MNKILAAAAIAGATAMFAVPAMANSGVVWTGVSATDDSTFGYVGGMMDFNGDLGTSGGVVRASISGGQYDYTNGNVAGNKVDGDQISAEILVGYRTVSEDQVVAFYIGVAGEDQDLSPNDPTNNVNGDEYGIKGLIDTNFNTNGDLGIDLTASYSTVFDTYYASLTLPYRFDGFSVGPQFAALGSESYDQQRIGAKVGFGFGSVNLSVDGGLAAGGRDSDNSFYAGLGLSTGF